jgi:YD repeat-containing protein
MFEGGYLTLMKDSGELVNTSNRTKLLYRVEIRPPDPEAVIATINVAGTELGEGSFIRVVALDLEGNPIRTRTEDYKRVHLENSLYKRISVYECQVVLELWGAPGTRNRLRVNRVRYFYPGRPIEPDVPPGAPRPARGIDYPRSADVQMGWDGENRRVWVRDGVGERRYTYDAWGRVTRQQGCCGSEIDIVAVEASYNAAGRRTEIREMARRWDGSEVAWRTIYTFYDGLGRVKAIGPSPYPPGSEGGASNVIYHYDSAGRLWKEAFPNGNHFIHTYYGAEAPEQQGQLKSIQLCLGDCTAVDEYGNPLGYPVFGYEYRYDLLGRVVWSRESPSGDETEYTYSPVGRLVYESRNGDVSYTRLYSYHLDGSRWWVWRVDGRYGEHFDWYSYDPVSGRLTQVYDQISGVVNSFAWNPEGTLAQWSDESAPYDRVYSYDEEGRLVRIGWDYRDGRERSRYEYRYNSDGFKVWERDWFESERGWQAYAYRFVCSIGCGALPLVIYRDEDGADDLASWSRYQWTTDLLRGFWYEGYEFESAFTWRNLDYELLAGYLWVADLWLPWSGGGFRMRYWDRYGLVVGERLYPAKPKELFFGRRENRDLPGEYVPVPTNPNLSPPVHLPLPSPPPSPKPLPPDIAQLPEPCQKLYTHCIEPIDENNPGGECDAWCLECCEALCPSFTADECYKEVCSRGWIIPDPEENCGMDLIGPKPKPRR